MRKNRADGTGLRGLPPPWYNEGFMSEDDFAHILEYSDMCDKHGQKAVDDYMEFHDELDYFEEGYYGEWDSEEDFARHIISKCYNLESEMGDLARYFDFEAFGCELLCTTTGRQQSRVPRHLTPNLPLS